MTNIPPATELSDNEKEYNWTIMLPIIILAWSVIGVIIWRPNLFIRCCQLICCTKQSNDEEKIGSLALTERIVRDLENIQQNELTSVAPNTSPNIRAQGQYIKLQEEGKTKKNSSISSDSDIDNLKPTTPSSRSLAESFRR